MTSTAIEYAITFLIGTTLITGLGAGLTDIVDNREETITQRHLEHVGGEISTLLTHHYEMQQRHDQTADRANDLGMAGGNSFSGSIVIDEPPEINGQSYIVQVAPNGDELIISGVNINIKTRVPIDEDIPVVPRSGGAGGELVIVTQPDGDIKLDSGGFEQ
jgi:hypothetical protein